MGKDKKQQTVYAVILEDGCGFQTSVHVFRSLRKARNYLRKYIGHDDYTVRSRLHGNWTHAYEVYRTVYGGVHTIERKVLI